MRLVDFLRKQVVCLMGKRKRENLWADWSEAKYARSNGGLRQVRPHRFCYTAHAKQRWFGRSILDVLVDEFMAFPREYVEEALAAGNRIMVNGTHVGPDYLIKNGDKLQHFVHRHEPAVSGAEIQIQRDEEHKLVIVNKPSSIPVHPCGKYHFNSLVYLLQKEHAVSVHPVHRLDRLTSGLCIFATDSDTAGRISAQIRNRDVQKFYLARVKGRFPDGVQTEESVFSSCMKHVLDLVDTQAAGEIIVDKPIYTVSHKLSQNAVPDESDEKANALAKEAMTGFKRLSYNAQCDDSVVLCRPFTGRTHQIRVHLQWLGHPIANDPSYGGSLCVGNALSANSVSDTSDYDPSCWECDPERRKALISYKPDYFFCNEIWLHASQYSGSSSGEGGSWEYQVSHPPWAFGEFDSTEYLKPCSGTIELADGND